MAVTFKPPRRPKEGAVGTQQSEGALEKPAAPDSEQREGDPEEAIPLGPTPPVHDANIFGPPPLARGEGPETYNAMLEAITAGVCPRDIIEEFLIRDIVYLVLEVQRLRRIKANLPSGAMVQGLRNILSDIEPMLNAVKLAERWVEREPQAVAQVEELLSKVVRTVLAWPPPKSMKINARRGITISRPPPAAFNNINALAATTPRNCRRSV